MVGFDYTGKEKEKKKHGEDYTEKKSRKLREREKDKFGRQPTLTVTYPAKKKSILKLKVTTFQAKEKKTTTFRHLVAGENIFLLLLYYIVYHSIYIGARPHDFYT